MSDIHISLQIAIAAGLWLAVCAVVRFALYPALEWICHRKLETWSFAAKKSFLLLMLAPLMWGLALVVVIATRLTTKNDRFRFLMGRMWSTAA